MVRFLVVAFGVAWPLQFAVAFGIVPAALELPLLGLAGLAPTLAALACDLRALAPLRGPWPLPWIAGAALAPTVLVVVSGLLAGKAPALAAPYLGAVLWPPLGEEPGWRGFLHRRVSERRGPLVAALLVSGCWAIWHLPTAFYPGADLAAFPLYAVGVACAGIIMAWAVERTRSLPVAVVAHAGLNGVFVQRDGGLTSRLIFLALLGLGVAAAARALARRAAPPESERKTWPLASDA